MVAEIISVGTEILMGNILNSNTKYLSEKCAGLGLAVNYHVSVGDNRERLTEVISQAVSRADIVLITGGLGPTEDDLTKECTAAVLGKKLVMDEYSKEKIRNILMNSIYRDNIPENNWKQAEVIEGCHIFENDNGLAPGIAVSSDEGVKCILLPGPPGELYPMFENKVYPYLAGLSEGIIESAMVKICGVGESRAETMILDLIDAQTNPTIATYAKEGEVHIRVTAYAASAQKAQALIKPVTDELISRFGDNYFTSDADETLEMKVVSMLREKGYTITTAESCSGGMIAGRIINVPGASEVFNEGHITYANEAKMKYLGVKAETLEKYGAVSEHTAYEMAEGAAKLSGADVAVAVTGIAGPDGGTVEKPVGTVFIGCCVAGAVTVKKYLFKGNREKIRAYTVQNALDLVRRCL